MSKFNGAQIKEVLPGSIAEEIGLKPGDIVKEINSKSLQDIIDYQYLVADEELTLNVLKANGEEWFVEIEKEPSEGLGIVFGEETFDGIKKCHNKCIFCFVDNLPRGLRKSLYIKDDDYRHSFLYGNYITLTNLKNNDLQRIVDLKLSPLYVSVHTTDSNLRMKILNNKNAGNIMDHLRFLVSGGIKVHTQAVLCPDINDGKYLHQTITDLASLWPGILTLALVPVGLTSFNTTDMRIYTKDECKNIISQVEKRQEQFLEKLGSRFVFLSDEFYLKAGYQVPEEDYYEGYPQLENGVGVVRLFKEELLEALPEQRVKREKPIDAVVVTGISSQDIMEEAVNKILSRVSNIKLQVKPLENKFFGYPVTVSGLLTGSDLIKGLKGQVREGQVIVIPDVMLKEDSQMFLDDLTIGDVAKELGVEIKILQASGKALVEFSTGEIGD